MTAHDTILADEVDVPGRPDVPGLRFRHFRQPDDFAGMAAANQRSRDASGIEEIATADGMARNYATFVNWDPYDDTVIIERDGAIVGYGRVDWRDLADGGRTFMTIVVVEPAHWGLGITTAVVAWAERRLVAKATAIPPSERRASAMRTFSFAAETDLVEGLTTRGWTRTGQGHEMVRPTLDDIPVVAMPDGLEVRSIGADAAAWRRVWDASAEAFSDERGEAVTTEADWESWRDDPLEDPSLWVIAFDGEEIAGGVDGRIDPEENAHHGRERGVIAGVWVRRPWRRRGLARALIAQALVGLRERGMTSAYLGVDGLNPNQAMTLYESLGFEIVSTTYDWTKPLPPELGGRATEATP